MAKWRKRRYKGIQRPMTNEYYIWRRCVYSRDRYKCQFPGCKVKRRLNAHHIVRWADCPILRYDKNNGITLCFLHHKLVTGNELAYAAEFMRIVQKNTLRIKK
jgi:hypothetical protein